MAVEDDPGRLRLRIFAFVALSLFGALFTRLWYLQGVESEEYQAEATVNVIREVYEEAPRGRILDRNGRVLVDNRVVDVVTVDRSAIADLDGDERDEMFRRLAVTISRSGRLTKVSSIQREVDNPEYGPFDVIPIAVDVDSELLVFLGERPDLFPGVDVVSRTVRSYPYGPVAAHVLGYVGPVTLGELESANARVEPGDPDRYQLNSEIGKSGVEQAFEDVLRGVPGVRYLEVDNRGEVIRERVELRREPIPGNDVVLTIDVDLQAVAEQELADGLARARNPGPAGEDNYVAAAGSVVAVDPRDGGVLAMASFPTYDPSDFVNGISFAQFERLTSPDSYAPILNRAIQGTYAPGSTFKVVTALAALEKGYLGPTSPIEQARDGTIYDAGTYVYPDCNQDYEAADSCEFESPFVGEATYPLWQALSDSSDVFFYTLGGEGFWKETVRGPEGDEYIQTVARRLGLGTTTGLQLPYERSGVVPDRAYFDAQAEAGVFLRDGSQWFPGDTIQLAIGQGDLLVSPLQLANLYATIANGGTLHQPNIVLRTQTADGETVLEFGPRVLRELDLPTDDLWDVEEGLINVTRSGTAAGTFAGFPFETWSVAGKTGTAQVRGKADTSLFAAYGPTRQPGELGGPEPEIAVAAVLEESGFGSEAAAPVIREILEPYATDTLPRARTVDEIDADRADGDDESAEADGADTAVATVPADREVLD